MESTQLAWCATACPGRDRVNEQGHSIAIGQLIGLLGGFRIADAYIGKRHMGYI
jgi:hypothetical protein